MVNLLQNKNFSESQSGLFTRTKSRTCKLCVIIPMSQDLVSFFAGSKFIYFLFDEAWS